MLRRFLGFTICLSSLVWAQSRAGSADVRPFGGVSHVILPGGLELSVVTDKDFDLKDEKGARRYWKTTISLRRERKVIWERVNREFNDLIWVYGDIVPIRKGRYHADLNGDGLVEVAILPWDFGMAVFRTAGIFTVRQNGLTKIGEGKYHFEQGPNVLLDCPKCWKFDLASCKRCR